MSRPKNAENNYQLTDAVTGETLHTNPKQFRALQARYSLTVDELKASYVGQKGRIKLTNDKETVASAIEKYNLHPNVANALRALRALRSKPVADVSTGAETDMSVEVPENAINPVEVVSDAITEPVEAETANIVEEEMVEV